MFEHRSSDGCMVQSYIRVELWSGASAPMYDPDEWFRCIVKQMLRVSWLKYLWYNALFSNCTHKIHHKRVKNDSLSILIEKDNRQLPAGLPVQSLRSLEWATYEPLASDGRRCKSFWGYQCANELVRLFDPFYFVSLLGNFPTGLTIINTFTMRFKRFYPKSWLD